jgi:hypothetical protein
MMADGLTGQAVGMSNWSQMIAMSTIISNECADAVQLWETAHDALLELCWCHRTSPLETPSTPVAVHSTESLSLPQRNPFLPLRHKLAACSFSVGPLAALLVDCL